MSSTKAMTSSNKNSGISRSSSSTYSRATDSPQTKNIDYRALFNSIPSPLLVLSPDESFTILDVNETYLDISGTTREQIIGTRIFESFPDNPEDKQATGTKNLRQSLLLVLKHQRIHAMELQKYDVKGPDGTFEERYWSPCNSPIFAFTKSSTSVSGGVDNDEDEKVDREMIGILHNPIEISDMMLQHRLDTDNPNLNGHISQEQENASKDSDSPVQDLTNDRIDRVWEELQELSNATKMSFQRMESELFNIDNEKLMYRTRNEQLEKEIKERQKIEEKYKGTIDRLRFILQVAQIGLWEWELNKETFDADHTVMKLFHLSGKSSDYTVDDLFAKMHPDDRKEFRARLEHSIKNKTVLSAEFRIMDGDTIVGYRATRSEVVVNEVTGVESLMGATWDISQIKQLEEQRLQLQTEKERTIEAEEYRKRLEEFIDTICHEMRNPLNGLFGCADIIHGIISSVETEMRNRRPMIPKETFEVFKTQLDLLKDVDSSVRVCMEQQKVIVNDVLDLSKLENNKFELVIRPFCPKKIIRNSLQMFRIPTSQKGLVMKCNLPEEELCITTDPVRLSQVLANLLSNSIKFTNEGGSVTIDMQFNHLSESEVEVEIRVTDTGIGMSEEEIDRLFLPFSQANSKIAVAFGGSGLGLAISEKLVKMMNGTIGVRSEKGVGTTFYFSIRAPLAPCPSDSESPLPLSSPNPKSRVLIVEDNRINQKVLANYLRQLGCSYKVVANGLDALNEVKRSPYDMIFMDIEMPVMDGLESTKLIRQYESLHSRKPSVIIGLSGNARQEQSDRAIQKGMDCYLTKPFHKSDILQQINRYLSES